MAEGKLFFLQMMKDYYDDKYIKAILTLPDGHKLIVIYQKMMLKSLENNGLLEFSKLRGTMEEELQMDLGEDLNSIRFLLEALDKFNLIERREDGSLFMVALPVGRIGKESTSAERVRRYREKKKYEEELKNNSRSSSAKLRVFEKK